MNMISAVVTAPRKVALHTQRLNDLSPKQLRVRLQGCGVCGSNLAVWQGAPWFRYPLAPGEPGHEGWGVVEAIGGEVDQFGIGDRVALLSYHAFAEFDDAEASSAIHLPPALNNQAFPGEAIGCAMNIFRRSDINAGQTVAVVGIGFMGALLVNLAANAGAKVIALYHRPFTGKIAHQMGATEIISMENSEVAVNEVKELTRGQFCERVIEATGLQRPLDLAGDICGERARLVIAGYHQGGTRRVNLQSWNWRGLDVINAHERDHKMYLEGMRTAVEAVTQGKLNPAPLYTHRFKLSEISSALDLLHDRPPDFLKALVTYD